MDELISRQVAIDRINTQREHLEPDVYPQDKIGDAAYRICAEFIERLPSAQPERKTGRWIPVTEQLPGSSGNYLVSVKSIGWNCKEYVVNDIAYWDSSEGFHKADEVIAWMPLPEPYKGGNDGTTD